MNESKFLSVALEAAREAEKVIKHYYESGVEVTMKEDYSPVTVADVETEKKIKEIILSAFPEHGFYGEETGKTNPDAEYNWLIDPIDGTKSFVRKYPFFSTQIALMHNNELILGVSNGVMFGELAWAEKGKGAFLNGERIQVSDIQTFKDASLSMSNIATMAADEKQWAAAGKLATQVHRTRGYGDFYHYHLLASGKIDIIVESDVNILDIGALSVIVNEAGGCFTDMQGNGLNLDTTSVIATNSQALYDQTFSLFQ
ncbi:MAG: inositol-phosphate phosphatase [Gammaproteobacteria bacterium]|nr:inositol-phosphate phosphatase [Gammaproteobacteria bacterium]